MAIDDTDRRRFVLAAIVSILALPVLLWVNRDDDAPGPKVATAGVEVGGATADSATSTAGQSNLPPATGVGSNAPIFLDGPVGDFGGISEIAVPPTPSPDTVITEASYRRSIVGADNCFSVDIQPGRTVTVVNLENKRTTTCRVALAPSNQVEKFVLHTDRFLELADLTDAPIPVEIRP